MATWYERLRAAVKAERDEPGSVTKSELDEVLRQFPATEPSTVDEYDDDAYDPESYA